MTLERDPEPTGNRQGSEPIRVLEDACQRGTDAQVAPPALGLWELVIDGMCTICTLFLNPGLCQQVTCRCVDTARNWVLNLGVTVMRRDK
jgi:hypothetical protein